MGRCRLWWAALWMLAPASALAGPVESPAAIAISPTDPTLWVVRYRYVGGGLVISRDGGKHWRMLCNTAIDPDLRRDTDGIAIAPGGELFTGTFEGMWKVATDGCSASEVPELDMRWVPTVINDPTDPARLFALTSNGNALNGIFVRDDATDTWTELGSRARILISRLEVVPMGEGVRFYQSVVDGELEVTDPGTGLPDYFPLNFIRRSDDMGETWTSEKGIEMSKGTVRLAAVDPTDPRRLIVTEGFGPDSELRDRVWVNGDAGATAAYSLLAEVGQLGGIAFAPDGRMWFGDAEDTVFLVPPGGAPVPLGEGIRPRCLHYDVHSQALLACRLTEVVRVEPDGALSSVLRFQDLDAWMVCGQGEPDAAGQGTIADRCRQQLTGDAWCGPVHYPEAGICAAYCYPGLNDNRIGDGDACPPGTVTPDRPDAGPAPGGQNPDPDPDPDPAEPTPVPGPAPDPAPGGGRPTTTTADAGALAPPRQPGGCGCSLGARGRQSSAGPLTGLAWLAGLTALALYTWLRLARIRLGRPPLRTRRRRRARRGARGAR